MAVRNISAVELAALLRAGAHAEQPPLLLDVREAWELSTAQLPNALHIPMREIPARFEEIDRDRTVICLCHHGMRSMQVGLFLQHQNFADVCNLTGGIDAWSRQVDASVPLY